MTKKDARNYIRRAHNILRTKKVNVKFAQMKTERGDIVFDCTAIHIRLHPEHEILPTLIHELLHYIHPTWNESDILAMESRIQRHLTPRISKNLLKKLLEKM